MIRRLPLKIIADIITITFFVAPLACYWWALLAPGSLRKGSSIFGFFPAPLELAMLDMIPVCFGMIWAVIRYAELCDKYPFFATWQFKIIIFPLILFTVVMIVKIINLALRGSA